MRESKERSSDSWPVTAATELPVDPSPRMMPATGLPSWCSSAGRRGTSVNSHDPAERLLGRHPRFLLGAEHLDRLEMLERRAIQSVCEEKAFALHVAEKLLEPIDGGVGIAAAGDHGYIGSLALGELNAL